MLVSIDSITEVETNEPTFVYDISTEKTNLFFANGILVHNTDSIFLFLDDILKMVLKDKYNETDNKEKATLTIKIVKQIANFINNKILPEAMVMHNTNNNDNEYTQRMTLQFKEEFVIRRGIYCVKKRYALWTIREGRNDIDKIDIKGLAPVRADTPQYIREFMIGLIHHILRTDNLDKKSITKKIINAIDEYKKLLEDGDIKAGIPGSYGMREYTKEPVAIKTMKIYNILFGETFRSGDRSYRFDIKHIFKEKIPDYGEKLQKIIDMDLLNKNQKEIKCISIPRDGKLDPNIFIPDEKSMMEVSIHKKLSNITDILGISTRTVEEEDLYW
jgi:DNA polymerase elongation subunit (family B)